MKTRLLFLALLAAALSGLAQPASAVILARVEQQTGSWTDWRVRAAEMESAFIDAVSASRNSKPFLDCIAGFDQDEVRTVRRIDEWRGEKLALWRSQAVTGQISADESARRASFVERLYKLRMLRIYGNIWPLSIDSCSVGADHQPNGRLLASPSWAIAASKEEFDIAEKELVRQSGFSEDDAYTH